MQFGGKEFDFYWKIIKIPVFVVVGWSLLGFIVSLISFSLYQSVFSNVSGIVLGILVFAFVGWTTIKDHKGNIKEGAWAGALTGVIAGFLGGIIGILMFYLVPDVLQASLQQATQQGANPDMVANFIKIGVFIGVVIGMLINSLLGAGIAAIASLIAKKTK